MAFRSVLNRPCQPRRTTETAGMLDHRNLRWRGVDRFVLAPVAAHLVPAGPQAAGLLLIGWLSGRFLWPWASGREPLLIGLVSRGLKRRERTLLGQRAGHGGGRWSRTHAARGVAHRAA